MVNINYNILYFFIAAPVIEWSGKIGNLQCRNRHNIDSESLFVLWDSLNPVSLSRSHRNKSDGMLRICLGRSGLKRKRRIFWRIARFWKGWLWRCFQERVEFQKPVVVLASCVSFGVSFRVLFDSVFFWWSWFQLWCEPVWCVAVCTCLPEVRGMVYL